MSENLIQVTITLSDPQLNDERLQEAVQNLRLELEEFEGVREVNLIPDKSAPVGSKSLGGFLLGKLKALVDLDSLKNTITLLNKRLFGRTIEIEAEGNGKKIKIKISHPEDLATVMPIVDNFIKG